MVSRIRLTACLVAVLLTCFISRGRADFTSGSSGIHGAFPPTALPVNTAYILWNMTTGFLRFCNNAYDTTNRPDSCPSVETGTAQIPGIPVGGLKTGVFEFTSVNVVPGNIGVVHIYLLGNPLNNPLTILSQNDIRLGPGSVLLHVDGEPGRSLASNNFSFSAGGGNGGPGGAAGGSGGIGGSTPSSGNQGQGAAGGAGGNVSAATVAALRGLGAGSSPAAFSLTPVRGGAGGGGGAGSAPNNPLGCGTALLGFGGGGGGGGGGGLLLAATNEIFLGNGNTQIDASGGNGGDNALTSCRTTGGGGEGGSVRLVSKSITGSGPIVVSGGTAPFGGAGNGAGGRVRIEANTNLYTGTITGASGGSFTQFPGIVTPGDLPSLRITSIGGVAVPTSPTGNLNTPDVNFATAPTNPVVVALAGSKIPLGTTVTVRVTPAIGSSTTTSSTALTGSLDNSTATASVDIPPGPGAIVATSTFTLPPGSAMLQGLPNLDPTKPHLVEVVAAAGGASKVYVIADDGTRFEIGSR